MLVVGLVGGAMADRLKLSCDLVEISKQNLSLQDLGSFGAASRRVKVLDAVLSGVEYSGPIDRGLVFPTVKSYEEAVRIRSKGGFLWHVQGTPSSDIPIERFDVMVTTKDGGDRHYLDVHEALCETILRARRVRAA